MTAMRNGPWIVTSKARPRLRLFCLPYAGSGASIFRAWSEKLPAEVEVCPVYLPGREARLRESLFSRLSPMVQALAQALYPYIDIPFAFFGYSMGALISFELTRYLRRMHSQAPTQLFVAAHRAPQLPDRNAPLHNKADAELIAMLSRMGGTPQAVLQHAELMQVLLPTLRADFELCETYSYVAESPLDCPITAFGGEQDTMVSVQEMAAWRQQTTQQFRLNVLPGDHFFMHSQQNLLLQTLSELLTRRF